MTASLIFALERSASSSSAPAKCACEMCSEYTKAKLDIACMVTCLSEREFRKCWLHTVCCSLT